MIPPIPEATTTPSRSGATPIASPPASAQASRPAINAIWLPRSIRRACTRSRTSVGSTATRPAMRTGRSAAQSSSRRRMPDRPASRDDQVPGTSPPTGVVAPSPVTTTVVELMALLLLGTRTDQSGVGGDVLDRVADRVQVLDLVVRDLDAEALLGGHDHLDHRQRVDVQVRDERLVRLHVLG